ncbi:MAG: C13 family peptidase [Nitrospira sp.]|nr:C13 family peptidase [Nitrospira sp.]
MSFQASPSQRLSHAMQGLSDLSQNLRSGATLACLLPVSRLSFVSSVDQLVGLLLFNFVIATLFSYIRMGHAAMFNYWQITALSVHALLLLFAGVLFSKLHEQNDWVLSLPLIAATTYLPYEMVYSTYSLLTRKELIHLSDTTETVLPILGWLWMGSVAFSFCAYVLELRRSKLLLGLVLLTFIIVVPHYYFPVTELWWSPSEEESAADTVSKPTSVTQEDIFYAQAGMLPKELALLQPGQPGQTDLYFLGMAPYASQDVFVKEITSVHDIFQRRFYTEGKSLTLINHHTTLHTAPLASLTSLRSALHRIGEAMNREEDILFLYITTHGSRTHHLSVELYPLELSAITPQALQTALAESAIKWKVIVISACYAGGFIEPLKDSHTAILTAADATHTSFGCGNQFNFTYFGQAFFDEQLRQTYSFTDAFDKARLAIATRETAESLTPSNPQIYISDIMRAKLQQYEKELSTRAAQALTLAHAQ